MNKTLDEIKDAFVQSYLNGEKPTVSELVAAHPIHADELIEFGMAFALLHAVPIVEEAPSQEALRAFDKFCEELDKP